MNDHEDHANEKFSSRLSSSDAAACDRIFDESFFTAPGSGDLGSPGSPPLSILSLLALSGEEERALQSTRDGRIASTLELASSLAPQSLSRESADELDRFVSGGAAPLLLTVLDDPMDDRSRSERIERVLLALENQDRMKRERFRMAPPSRTEVRRTARIRLGDLVSLAAVLLIGTAALFPSAFAVSGSAEEIRCALNMQRAGLGFSLFAQDHDGHMPAMNSRAPQSQPQQWWLVGDPSQSHSANLFVLVRQDYVPLEALACPGNRRAPVDHSHALPDDWRHGEELSYSYQLFGDAPPRFSDRSLSIVLADRSPVVAKAMRGQTVDATVNSRNHRSRGQNLLLPDFSVMFVPSPQLANGDNIWLPRHLEASPRRVRMTGSERPATPQDAFVGP